MTNARKWLLRGGIALVVLAVLFGAYRWLQPDGLPEGIASGNGRIEATEIDIATRTPSRVEAMLVNEGDFVTAGQVLARMDTAVLRAQLREAEAQLQQAVIGVGTAQSLVVQRKAEHEAAVATVAQREAETEGAERRLARSEELARRGTGAIQVMDDDRASFEAARAGASAAKAQVAAAEVAIKVAEARIVDAEAAVSAAKATIERIQADIDDSELKSPRDGRVQYRVAQPGEVLPAGGTVLNLVDLGDVYMTFFLPTEAAGRVTLGTEVHLVLDAAPQYVVPANATFVADVAQFTPKTVETADERQKLMFRVKARIPPELLQKYIQDVKTGLPGMAYIKLDPEAEWPDGLQVNVPL
ncbi:HlyD family secretion protein [Geminicoccus flavidas]|uniref:HlyD family secretion protein n=1 Tax=Geminicoccus flavidas TaxID=2506407 RepID=UPI00135A8856|nr:HlyD family efflux transporter periplasmic adaptor subunit [Geminicoccus flavidas]